jgi:predicted nucleic acid-binding protein
MLQCGRRRLHHGVAIGFLPTAPKWATLDLTTKKNGAAAVDTADPLLGYATLVQLRLHSRPTMGRCRLLRIRRSRSYASPSREGKILATPTSPALYVAGDLTTAFLPRLHSAAVLNLAQRLHRLLPTVVMSLVAIFRANAEKKPATLAAILLATAALYGLVSSNPTPHGLYRIYYDAFKTLLDLSHEICSGGVVATGQTATYMKIVCPNTLLIYPPKILDAMAADDPEAAEARRILAQIQNSTIHGYSWLVVQEPVPGQWYDEVVATFIQQLKDQIYILGDVKYILKNQGATLYIVKIR